MANIKSQKKRIITNEKARMRNRAVRSELKTAIRVVREAVEAKDGATAYAAALKACRLLDKAASKGIIHKRQAASLLTRLLLLKTSQHTSPLKRRLLLPTATRRLLLRLPARKPWLPHLLKRLSAARQP